MANQVKFKADLDDNVSSRLDKIRDKFNTIGGKGTAASLLGNIGAKAAAKALDLVSAGISFVIGKFDEMQQAYRDDQASQAKLVTSLKANVAGWSGNADAIEGVLAARMKLGFSDDEQRNSLASLVTRTKDHIEALRLQRIAMDLARLRGMDLSAATDLIGKAYSGQVGALRRAGIAVDANATATEALAAVQKAAGGQAEAFAATSEGRVVVSQVKAGEAMEKFGKIIDRITQQALPPLVDGLTFVADAVDAVSQSSGDSMAKIVESFEKGNKSAASELWQMAKQLGITREELVRQTKLATSETIQAIKDKDQSFAAVSADFAAGLPEGMEAASAKAVKVARKTPTEIANALREGRSQWQEALYELQHDASTSLTRTAEIAKLKALLAGKEMAKGLASSDPIVRAEWAALNETARERLGLLSGIAAKAGSTAAKDLARAIKREKKGTAEAAELHDIAVKNALGQLPSSAYGWGKGVGRNFAKGITATIPLVTTAANNMANEARLYIGILSPAKKGPLSGIGPEGFGRNLAASFAKGMTDSIGYVEAASNALAEGVSMGGSRSGTSRIGVGSADSFARVTIPVLIDGREVARIADENLFYRSLAAPRTD